MPTFLKDGVPEMTQEVEWFFSAWSRLSESRTVAGSSTVRALTMPEMESHMRMFNYAGSAEVFVDCIQGIDKLYMARAMRG